MAKKDSKNVFSRLFSSITDRFYTVAATAAVTLIISSIPWVAYLVEVNARVDAQQRQIDTIEGSIEGIDGLLLIDRQDIQEIREDLREIKGGINILINQHNK